MADALIRAYFQQGLNIHDQDTLADIATQHGFSHDEVVQIIQDRRELALTEAVAGQSRTQGVRSVPHFRIGDISLVGCRSEVEIAIAITEALQQGTN